MRKVNVRWRPILFWSHLVCGVAAGLVIFFLALTGSVLSFEKPILAWSDAHTMSNLQVSGQQLPVSELLERVKATAGQAATSVTIPADSRSPITFEVGRDRAYLANPYTGSVAPSSPKLRGFFHFVLTLHRWFALSDANHKTVELVNGSAALVFAFLILSGCIIWLPKVWTASTLRTRLRPMWPANSHARNWNWHSAFGFWLAVPLLAISLTGVIMGLPWANELLFRATGSPLPPQRGEGRPDSRGGEGKGFARDGAQSGQHHEGRGQEADHAQNNAPAKGPANTLANAKHDDSAPKHEHSKPAEAAPVKDASVADAAKGEHPEHPWNHDHAGQGDHPRNHESHDDAASGDHPWHHDGEQNHAEHKHADGAEAEHAKHEGGVTSPGHMAMNPKSGAQMAKASASDKKEHQPLADHTASQAPHADRPASVDIDRILHSAAHQSQDWLSLQLRIPNGGGRAINVTVDRGNGAQPQYRDTLTYDAQGNLQRTETFASQSLGRRARAITRYLHTGEIFGFAGELVGFLACLAACLLVWTGFALSLRRFTRKKQPKPAAL